MTYLLDTNAIIALLNDPDGAIGQRIRRHDPSDVGVSSVTLHELYYGAFRSRNTQRNVATVDQLPLEVVALDGDDAREAGDIRATLANRGMSIGPYDLLIGGQARSRGLTLVTANTREFDRVDGLDVEDWTRATRQA